MNVKSSPLTHTPRQRRGRETQARIIEAGITLLETHSLDEISMGQIAKLAYCSTGNLYKRFANKEALLARIIDTARDRITEDIETTLATGPGKGRKLENAVADVVELQIRIVTQYRPVIKAMALDRMKRHEIRPEQDLRGIRAILIDGAIAITMSCLPEKRRGDDIERRLRIAYEMALSALHENTLFGTSSINLDDEDLGPNMTRIILSFLNP